VTTVTLPLINVLALSHGQISHNAARCRCGRDCHGHGGGTPGGGTHGGRGVAGWWCGCGGTCGGGVGLQQVSTNHVLKQEPSGAVGAVGRVDRSAFLERVASLTLASELRRIEAALSWSL
jgi:hypothetical protein